MGKTQTATKPVNPLTGELSDISIAHGADRTDVRGRIITPGLAITPHRDNGGKQPNRYVLTHIPSGLAAGTTKCGVHVQQAAQAATDAGIDWTVNKDSVVAALKAHEGLIGTLFQIRCTDWCEGDGPQPPSYSVRCDTCDWEYDPEDDHNEGPLTFEDARRMGRDHECEPRIEISLPDTSDWHPEWRFDKGGQLMPTTASCTNCDEVVEDIGRRHGALWQHKATRFVMCADGRSHATPKTASPAQEG